MKRRYRLVGLIIGLAATAGSIYLIASSWHGHDLRVYASTQSLTGLALGVSFYVLGVMVSALAWRCLIADVGLGNRWPELAGIVSVTQIGKYLPGNVAQHVGRAGMSFNRGIGPGPFMVTVGVEMVLLMLASVIVGVSALLASGSRYSTLIAGKAQALALIAVLATTFVLGLIALRRFGPSLLARFAPRQAHWFGPGTLPSSKALIQALLLYCLVYLAFGAGIVGMARLLAPDVPQHGWLLIASFALAWIVGFVTPGAPAGVGVREGVMLLFLGTAYPAAEAGVIVVALRLVTTFGDVLLLPIGWLLLRIGASQRRPSQADSCR